MAGGKHRRQGDVTETHARRHGGALGCQAPPVAAGAPPDENSADGITCLRSSTIV